MQEEHQLVLRKVAAREAGVSIAMISYWVKRGYIKQYFLDGNLYNYFVDLTEVLDQYELGIERKSKLYNLNWHLQPRGPKGWVKAKDLQTS